MVTKKEKDAENGLQVLTFITIIWAVGFFYWSRDGTILGYKGGQLAYACCSSVNILLIIIFSAAWIFTRKENRVKKYIEDHLKTCNSISVDEIVLRFGMKRAGAVRTLHFWMAGANIEGDYDEKTGLFCVKQSPKDSSQKIDL